MTLNQALKWAIKEIKKTKIDSAVLDAEILLSFAVKKPKEWILTHPDYKLKIQEYKNIKKYISRRKKREPVAYITGTKEFFGLDFFVDKNVLVPRPETELMVEEALEIIKYNANDANEMRMTQMSNGKKINLIDIGAGSGCIPISIASNLSSKMDDRPFLTTKQIKIFAVDFSAKALKIARKNAAKHKVKINFIRGNLLNKLRKYGIKRNTEYGKKFYKSAKTIITANLPYLSEAQYKKLPLEIKKYEPKSALVAGKDGLKYYRELLMDFHRRTLGHQVSRLGHCGTPRSDGVIPGGEIHGNDITILLEIDPAQSKKIKKIIRKIFPKAKVEIQKDLSRQDRLVIIKI